MIKRGLKRLFWKMTKRPTKFWIIKIQFQSWRIHWSRVYFNLKRWTWNDELHLSVASERFLDEIKRKNWICFFGSWSTARNLFARKNWLTHFFICSTPFEQMLLFLSTGRKSKIICRTCISSSFTFGQKNINCSNCNWSTKVLENVNCSTQFIVKKMV